MQVGLVLEGLQAIENFLVIGLVAKANGFLLAQSLARVGECALFGGEFFLEYLAEGVAALTLRIGADLRKA